MSHHFLVQQLNSSLLVVFTKTEILRNHSHVVAYIAWQCYPTSQPHHGPEEGMICLQAWHLFVTLSHHQIHHICLLCLFPFPPPPPFSQLGGY